MESIEAADVGKEDGHEEEEKAEDTDTRHPFDRVSMPGLSLVNSKSQGGKSHLIHCLFYHHRKKFKRGKGRGIVFSNTSFNSANITFVPRCFKHMRYNPEVLREMMRLQMEIPEDERPLTFILFDDCITELQDNDKVLFEACTQTPHYNLFILISTQHVNSVPSFARDNAFQTFLFKMFTENSLKACYQSYGQDFNNMNDFRDKVNKKLAKHVFAFSDRQEQGPWIFLKCPPGPLPKFMLDYGPKEEDYSKKRKRKRVKDKEDDKKKRRKRARVESESHEST